MVGIMKWSDGHGCAVLQYFVRERNFFYKAVRAGSSLFVSRGAWTGGEQQVVMLWPLLLLRHLEHRGTSRNEPSLPLSSRKAGPLCCKGCGKSSRGYFASSVLLKAPRWGVLVLQNVCTWKCVSVRVQCSCWVWLLLCFHVQECCGSLISLVSRQWETPVILLTRGFTHLTFVWGSLFAQHWESTDDLYLCISIKRLR